MEGPVQAMEVVDLERGCGGGELVKTEKGESCVFAAGDGIESVEGIKLCWNPSMVVAVERPSDARNETTTRTTVSRREVAMGVRAKWVRLNQGRWYLKDNVRGSTKQLPELVRGDSGASERRVGMRMAKHADRMIV